jgi:hypothetical protein
VEISYPSVSHPHIIVTSTTQGDAKWIAMGLHLPPQIKIDEIILCCHVSNPNSLIAQVQLVEMTAPDHALVRHDDPTGLKSTSPQCYRSKVGEFIPTGALTLALRLNVQHPTDQIKLGGVGVKVRSTAELYIN